MMRLALLSDIHGNCVALDAVLGQLATQNVTQLICLGDVASTGPQPREVIRRLQEIDCPSVMGNMDTWLLQPELKEQPDQRRQYWQDIDHWCAEQLTSADQAYLRSFRPTIDYRFPDGKNLLCYHGSPRSYSERLLSTTSEEELERVFAGTQGDLMAGGHTHIQLFRRFKERIVLNLGSVGLAMDRVSPVNEIRQSAFAEYAIIDSNGASLQVELHRVAFDLQAFIHVMHDSGMPHAAWWASCWKEM
ncbi:metallophosphoesterase family protein [Tengunoibacter tsumagoiensis]|uniref:Serine/threonine protein phosphatase n=1 Tax=Tengunoibacter tsumagoiensis TaxID=2014871 RepID=A0A402A0C0_9CHLR|nr:metallophosphoesterase family protein [Tengunoibacter tsumagoiensis]GCE12451.1 serine/threonine protein phosphatase [Tengunoibacter tsumagoiensis]